MARFTRAGEASPVRSLTAQRGGWFMKGRSLTLTPLGPSGDDTYFESLGVLGGCVGAGLVSLGTKGRFARESSYTDVGVGTNTLCRHNLCFLGKFRGCVGTIPVRRNISPEVLASRPSECPAAMESDECRYCVRTSCGSGPSITIVRGRVRCKFANQRIGADPPYHPAH